MTKKRTTKKGTLESIYDKAKDVVSDILPESIGGTAAKKTVGKKKVAAKVPTPRSTSTKPMPITKTKAASKPQSSVAGTGNGRKIKDTAAKAASKAKKAISKPASKAGKGSSIS